MTSITTHNQESHVMKFYSREKIIEMIADKRNEKIEDLFYIYSKQEVEDLYNDFLEEKYGEVDICGHVLPAFEVFKKFYNQRYCFELLDFCESEFINFSNGYLDRDDIEKYVEKNLNLLDLRNCRLEWNFAE